MFRKLFLLIPVCLFAQKDSEQSLSQTGSACGCPWESSVALHRPCDAMLEYYATPSAGPRVKGGAGYFMTGSYLYWTGRESGLEFVTSGVQNFGIEPEKRGEVFEPDFRYYSGFKFGLGVSLEHDDWDLFGQVTWIQPKGTKRFVTRDSATTDLQRTWYIGGSINSDFIPYKANAEWKLQFQVVELELGRNSFFSKYLSFRPHFGLKGTWQQQDYVVHYDSVTNLGVMQEERMHITQDSYGLGMRTGFDGAWHFNKYWSFIGDVAFSGLWSYFDVQRSDRIGTNGVDFVRFRTENGTHTIQPVLEFATGLRGEVWFFNSLYHLSIDMLWEEQRWFQMNKLYRVLEETDHGSLVMQGFTLRLRFDF
ncbi:MAG: Lpg1974 family pore-forming outer membrane protein [Candidatus Algichlamydia australiensis]|nr:Lpg1974 family pore-forming outer membrane protein [Chlamydiales bacterium]